MTPVSPTPWTEMSTAVLPILFTTAGVPAAPMEAAWRLTDHRLACSAQTRPQSLSNDHGLPNASCQKNLLPSAISAV
jgi:hypothetical protein